MTQLWRLYGKSVMPLCFFCVLPYVIEYSAHTKKHRACFNKTVISLTMHKSIYRHMLLWLEMDFIQVYWGDITELE